MTITMSSREFNQETGRAKKAAEDGPVFITDRGEPSHVLLSIEEYRKLAAAVQAQPAKKQSLAEALYMPGMAEIDFEIPELKGDWGLKIPDFS